MGGVTWAAIALHNFVSFVGWLQVQHFRQFRGESEFVKLLIGVSALAAIATSLVFLGYCSYRAAWWSPLVIILINAVVGIAVLERVARFVGMAAFSFISLLLWPAAAFFMFGLV